MTGRGLGLIAAIAVAAAVCVPAAGAADSSRASLQDFSCRQAASPSHRTVAVTAVMRPIPGTHWMQLRFQLLERPATSSSFHQVRGGDLGRWRRPQPPSLGRHPGDVWIVKKPVSDLPAPAVYRFRVSFRWLNASKRVIGSQSAASPQCKQHQ